MGILCLGARIGTASECTGNRPNPGSSTSHKDFGASVHFDGSGVRRPSEATQLPVVSTADGLAIKQRITQLLFLSGRGSVSVNRKSDLEPTRRRNFVVLWLGRRRWRPPEVGWLHLADSRPTRRSEPTPRSPCGRLSFPDSVGCPCIRKPFRFARLGTVSPYPRTRADT